MIGAAFQSSALTIGRPAGSAWIGKPLDLVIPLELDRSESGDSLCLQADVLQGEARLDDKRVTLSLDPGPSPDAPRVRLRTTRAVEEPVVTVKLTAGCVTKSTRQYVLLADLPEAPPVVASPSRLAPPTAAAALAAGEASGAPAPAQARPSRPSRPARAAQGSGSGARDAAGASAEVARPAPPRTRAAPVSPPVAAVEAARKPRPPAAKPAAVPPPAGEPKSRLQLDALAPEAPTQTPRPTLAPGNGASGTQSALQPAPSTAPASSSASAPASESSATAPAAAAASEGGGATVAAALAAAAEQGRRDADRLKEMEAALATLREQSVQNQRQLLELRGHLAQAEADRYRNPVIYVLMALLALALVALVALWRQSRNVRQAAWWGGAAEDQAASKAMAPRPPLPRHGDLADDDDDDDTEANLAAAADVTGLHSAAQGLRVTALPDGVGASAFQGMPARAVNAEQLLDVQQQAEFFLSLGQHDQAIGVLREHIAASPGTSAMAYLDLLSLLKSQDRRTDYAAVALEFGHGFNVAVPDFDQFTGGDRGLEHYPEVLLLIVEKWPSQGTADLIEAFVFRKPSSAEDVFDLPAYQDLLMLYSVARDLSEYAGPWGVPREVPVAPPVAVPPGHADPAYQPTAPMPYLRSEAADEGAAPASSSAPEPATQAHAMPSLELDLSDLDRTAFETLRAPIEPEQPASRPPAMPTIDPHLIDFDPFDPDPNQGERRPRHLGVKR